MTFKNSQEDLSGQKFVRLTAIEKDASRSHNHYVCKCDCGNVKSVRAINLKNGKSKSCGCLMKEVNAQMRKTHGKTGSRIHTIHRGMLQRCNDKNHPNYQRYGALGVTVCDRWQGKDGLLNFLQDMGEPGDGQSLDRIDGAKGYSPENCRWADAETQSRNRKSVIQITAFGVTKPLWKWAEESGIDSGLIQARINRLGWSAEDAITRKTK